MVRRIISYLRRRIKVFLIALPFFGMQIAIRNAGPVSLVKYMGDNFFSSP